MLAGLGTWSVTSGNCNTILTILPQIVGMFSSPLTLMTSSFGSADKTLKQPTPRSCQMLLVTVGAVFTEGNIYLIVVSWNECCFDSDNCQSVTMNENVGPDEVSTYEGLLLLNNLLPIKYCFCVFRK